MREPPYLEWMLELLDLAPRQRVLEIGCGRGHAVGPICGRIPGGRMVALDRSRIQVEAAERSNAEWVAAGRAVFLTASLEAADLGADRFHRALAVNVNVFWTAPGTVLPALARLLAPRGRLVLLFRPPAAAQAGTIAERCLRGLEAEGFRDATAETRVVAGARMAAITAAAP